jgi:hypothetical protein
LKIIWYCNNIPLKNTRDVTLTFDGQLCTLIKDRCEKENDSGLYRITAVNSMGQAESICQVNIQSKDTPLFRERLQAARSTPIIHQSLENKTAHEGERIILQVRISGQPKPQIIWYKDNQPLRNTHDHKVCFIEKQKIKRKKFFLNRFEIKMIFIHLKYRNYFWTMLVLIWLKQLILKVKLNVKVY